MPSSDSANQKLNPLECGGKRSATPLWISFVVQRKEIQGGVALRLPPHSKGWS